MTGHAAGPIESIVVVVPTRNEEELLGRCLASVTAAIARLAAGPEPAPHVTVVVVLDRCTDRSASIAAAWPGFLRLESDAGAVGSARRAGVRRALPTRASFTAETWIASTDADSAVPENWLTAQLAFARNGVDLLLGTVVPDEQLDADGRDAWAAGHELVDGHPHVHGANLGVRADRYLAAGEFPDVSVHEDVLLVAALRASPVVELHTARIPVLTSGRLSGRAPAGFATYLQDLQAGNDA